MQLSGRDPAGRWILSVLLKITYAILPDGSLEPVPEQVPLVCEPVAHPEIKGLLVHDIDIYPYKSATDVVVKGHAYGRGRSAFVAGVAVGGVEKRVIVMGERRCTLDATGRIVISEPKEVDKVPLSYTHAYGGRDDAAEKKYGNPYLALHPAVDPRSCDLDMASPFLYPRNPCGTGYLIEPERSAVETLRLPMLEDPADPITPDRLCAGDPLQWIRMPLPQGFDWYDYGWYPRIAYAGLVPAFEPEDAVPEEVRRGLAPSWITRDRAVDAQSVFLLVQGASPGLSVPHLRGGEEIILANVHPVRDILRIRLPKRPPRLWTDARNGRLNPTEPVMHTLLVEPDDERVCIVWRGCAPALRPYMKRELDSMPLLAEWP